MTDKTSSCFIIAVLVLISAAAFEPVRNSQFVFDDEFYIVDNPGVSKGLTAESVIWAFKNSYVSNYHPLTWLSHMFDRQLFGLNPLWHHIHNLILHCINVLLLFWILSKTTHRLWASAFIAAVFAVHPLRVESVGWVSERKDVLSGLFWLLTIIAYLKYAQKPSLGKYLLVVFAFIMGLLAKPMLVTLPFVLLLLDYWPLRRFGAVGQNQQYHKASVLTLILEKIPLIILSFVSSVVTFIVQKAGGSVAHSDRLPLTIRLANAFVSYISYIIKIFYPRDLCIFYTHHLYTITQSVPIVSLFVLIIVSLIIVVLIRKKPWLAVGWFWYLGTLVPVIGLVQVGCQSMADRYTYIPSIGIYLIFTFVITDIAAKLHIKKTVLFVLAAGVVLALTFVTRSQLRYWKNNLVLFKHALEVTEDNWFMFYCYGDTLAKMGRYDEAVEKMEQSLRINPSRQDIRNSLANVYLTQSNYVEAFKVYNQIILEDPESAIAYYNLGILYGKLGETERAEQSYTKALRISPDFEKAHYSLGRLLFKKGQMEEAAAHFKAAINLNPNWSLPKSALQRIRDMQKKEQLLPEQIEELKRSLQENPDQPEILGKMALISMVQNNLQAAAEYWQRALTLKPDWVDAHNNLAEVLEKQGKSEQAVDNWEKVLKLATDNFTANIKLGAVYFERGKKRLAAELWTRAIETNPDSAETLNNLAWILATSKDVKLYEPGKAVEFAERACQITNNTKPDLLDTLAVAYAANGNFEKAITVSKQAYALALIEGRDDIAAQLQKHLDLYQSGTPYLE